MLKKRYKAALVILILVICGFSCYLVSSKLKTKNIDPNKKLVNKEKNLDKMTMRSNIKEEVSPNCKIIFKIKYNKSGSVITEKKQKANEKLVGKNKQELENIYKKDGYIVESIKPLEVILVKEVNKYVPNKYVVGIKDSYISIFKTDDKGNMYIEDEKKDITDINIERLKQEDIKLLTDGDEYFQCDTREGAQAILEDYE